MLFCMFVKAITFSGEAWNVDVVLGNGAIDNLCACSINAELEIYVSRIYVVGISMRLKGLGTTLPWHLVGPKKSIAIKLNRAHLPT